MILELAFQGKNLHTDALINIYILSVSIEFLRWFDYEPKLLLFLLLPLLLLFI